LQNFYKNKSDLEDKINQLHLNYENVIKTLEINDIKFNNEKVKLVDELNKQEYNHIQIITESKKEINKLKNESENN